LEARLAELIREALRLPSDQAIARDAQLADPGVDSLAALEIAEEVTARTGISVPINLMFDIGSLQDLSSALLSLFEESFPREERAS
jgi:acyl carrier protein